MCSTQAAVGPGFEYGLFAVAVLMDTAVFVLQIDPVTVRPLLLKITGDTFFQRA